MDVDADRSTRGPEIEPGEVVGDYQIDRLLGEGRFARVYLARQLSLDRFVVLKVSHDSGGEGKKLARLDHSNILPVYSEQREAGRCLLVMPYVRGKTLADWLLARGPIDADRWRGRDLLDWLNRQVSDSQGPSDEEGIGRELAPQRFVSAMCLILLNLARALRHAHDRGLLHRDIKPANILLDVHGRPLLMDFNMAAPAVADNETDRGRWGGTLPYMAPEHLAVLAPDAPGLSRSVDQRSDLFALGVVFYEMLAGSHPWPQPDNDTSLAATAYQLLAERLRGAPPLPVSVAGASPGLRSVVSRLLASRQDERYQTAAELIEDLERLIAHRPLRYAPDPSRRERALKWLRRHPRTVTACATTVTTVTLLLLAAAGADLRRLGHAERLLADATVRFDAGANQEAAELLLEIENLLARPYWLLPESFGRFQKPKAQRQAGVLARQVAMRMLQEFASLADQWRAEAGLTGAVGQAEDPLAVYQILDRPDWEQLPQWQALEPFERTRIGQEVTELLLLRMLAPSNDHGPPKSVASGRDENLSCGALIDRIPAVHRKLPLVELARRHAQGSKNHLATAALVDARCSGFEHYLVGMIAAQRGELGLAIQQLDMVELQDLADARMRFAKHFTRASCCQQLGRTDEAILDYGVCLGLRGDLPWPYHNLGLLYAAQGNYGRAADEFERAIERADGLASAHANLGVARFKLGDYPRAFDALDRAVTLGLGTAEVLTNRAAARAAAGDAAGARVDLDEALKLDPDHQPAKESMRRLDGR